MFASPIHKKFCSAVVVGTGAKNKLFQYIGYLAPRITGAAMKKAIFDKLPARDDLAMGHVAVDTAPVS